MSSLFVYCTSNRFSISLPKVDCITKVHYRCIYVESFITKMKMKKYVCEPCDWVYDPEIGDPDGGIAPGTPFEDIPDDWVCPICGAEKSDFRPLED